MPHAQFRHQRIEEPIKQAGGDDTHCWLYWKLVGQGIGNPLRFSFGLSNSYSRSGRFQLADLILTRVLGVQHAGGRDKALQRQEKPSLEGWINSRISEFRWNWKDKWALRQQQNVKCLPIETQRVHTSNPAIRTLCCLWAGGEDERNVREEGLS